MSINLKAPELRELKPRIMVCGVGGAGGNAVNNMIVSGLVGVDFIVANTDAQALSSSRAERIIQMGLQVTEGLGAGSKPEVGRAAAEEAIEEIRDHLAGAHMVFVTAGMGGGTGTGAAPVIARVAREMGILTVGVVTKPFHFEGGRRMRLAEGGIAELHKSVDTLIIIPNQNLFRANEKTTFADAFAMADQVLYSGVACITDLMVKEGLINLDFADIRSILSEMGTAMMGAGEATGERRAVQAAEAAIANSLLDEVSKKGARGLLISIAGGNDLTLSEVDEAASRIRQEVDEGANIILGATLDSALDGVVRVSVVASEPAVAVAAAAFAQDDVPSKPLLDVEPAPERREKPGAGASAPERLSDRSSRMPQIDDLPRSAQNQIRAHHSDSPPATPTPDARRRSLLERLAASGIRGQGDAVPAPHSREPDKPSDATLNTERPPALEERPESGEVNSDPPPHLSLHERLAQFRLSRQRDTVPQSRALTPPEKPSDAALNAQRSSAREERPSSTEVNLDLHRRLAAQSDSARDDQLGVPAFLRRYNEAAVSPEYTPLTEEQLETQATSATKLAPVNRDTPASTSPETSVIVPPVDQVDVSAFAPRQCNPDSRFLIQVFLHVPLDRESAIRLASEKDPETEARGVDTLDVDLVRGEKIDIVVDAPDFKILEPRVTIIWRGRPKSCDFESLVPATISMGQHRISVHVLRHCVPVGRINFIIKVAHSTTRYSNVIVGDSSRRYCSAFISYASSDRIKALRCAQALRAARISVFQDVLSLNPGERWEHKLYRQIDLCDLFILCWSTAASKSDWVLKETLYALSCQSRSEHRLPDIAPAILEGPPPPERPEQLKDIHFNDPIAYIIAAEEALNKHQ
jgi:cell division protein FtsZ